MSYFKFYNSILSNAPLESSLKWREKKKKNSNIHGNEIENESNEGKPHDDFRWRSQVYV